MLRAMEVAKEDFLIVRTELGRILWWRHGTLLFITRVDHRGKRRSSFLYALAARIMPIPERPGLRT
jgi:hypothetical protein